MISGKHDLLEIEALGEKGKEPRHYDVVFCTDRIQDLVLMATAGRSLLENCSLPSRVRFHILSASLGVDDFERVIESWSDFHPACTFYPLGEGRPEKAAGFSGGYWDWMALGRCLPDETTRALYLDCDVLVLDDIAELWSIPLDDKVMAGVLDPCARLHSYQKALVEYGNANGIDYPLEAPYYNAGVFFINLQRWRSERVWERCEEIFGEHRSSNPATFHDQSEVNLLLWDRIFTLSPSWNLIETLELYEAWDYELYKQFEPSDYFQPKLRHFAGPGKPTSKWARLSEKKTFYQYLDRTRWSGWRSPSDQTLWGNLCAELLELHYILTRGFKQKALPGKWARLKSLLCKAPYLPLFYLAVPLNRCRLWLWRKLSGK